MGVRDAWRRVEPHGDVLLAAGLVVLGQCELYIRSLKADFHGPDLVNSLLVILFALPVIWRRRAPLVALIVFWVPTQIWLDTLYGANSNLPIEPFLVLLILVYSAASHTHGTEATAVLVLLGVLAASELALLAAGRKGWGNVVPGLVFIGLAYGLGRGLRRRRLETAAHARRADLLEREQAERAARAVREERDRIARELHDVIAHSVSIMVVQAGAAERLFGRDDAGGRQALGTIRAAGTDALDELRRLLGLLRDGAADGSSGEPQPSLRRLDELIGQARAGGLRVHCEVVGRPGGSADLPPGIDLAAYRVVQEALTNVRKHAGSASARVRIDQGPHELLIRVTDDGAPGGNGGPGGAPGHGILGMRERVALYGGTLLCGPRDGGGYEVSARIPLAAPA